MHRRRFLASALATSAFAITGKSEAQPSAGKPREYYELRKYFMQSGPQTKLTESYLSGALIPALNRLGMSPVGAFNLTIGPETPTLYVLIPSTSVEAAGHRRSEPGQGPAVHAGRRALLGGRGKRAALQSH